MVCQDLPTLAVSDSEDLYLTCSPTPLNFTYVRYAGETKFTEIPNKSEIGEFYGKRMYKYDLGGGEIKIRSAAAGTLNWRTDFTKKISKTFTKSTMRIKNGTLVVIAMEKGNSDTLPLQSYTFALPK